MTLIKYPEAYTGKCGKCGKWAQVRYSSIQKIDLCPRCLTKENCEHKKMEIFNLGRCYNRCYCPDCGYDTTIDSSD